ncbi:MAG: TIGR04255 family protein [Verrucomicrobia bacterium]|nr:TIGR04255 family protein [Verrucomicrobiota bacterium]MCH8528060.1 TIGR04255 family protein [Kiritimatiellia bacterium]
MSDRIHPPLKLPRSPLIFVLAQVRFPESLGIKERIPVIQDALRKLGYLKVNQREIIQTRRDSQNNVISKQIHNQWEFIDRAGTQSVLVDPRFVNVNASEYDVFEAFQKCVAKVLGVVASCIEPGLIERLGLRYVDLISPCEGHGMVDYVDPALRGFQIDPDKDREAYYIETITKTGEHKRFIHRYTETERGLGFPPDLLPSGLRLRQDPRRDSVFGLLDMDHILTQELNVEPDSILEAFTDLHAHHIKAFKRSVTQGALDEWSQP